MRLVARLILICCFVIGFCGVSIAKGDNSKMQIIKKNSFEFELQLYNGKDLPSLIPSFPENEYGINATNIKYIYGSIRYAGKGAAYSTFQVISPNNPSLCSDETTISIFGSERVYFLLWARSPYMNTMDEDAIFDVKINKKMIK